MLKSMYKFIFNTFHNSIRVSYWPCPIVLSGMQHRAWWTSSLPTKFLLLLIMLSLKLVCIDRHFFWILRPSSKKYRDLQDLHIYYSCSLTFTVSEANDGYLSSKTLNRSSHWTRKCTHGIITVVSNHLAFLPGIHVHVPFVCMETSVDCCSGIMTRMLP